MGFIGTLTPGGKGGTFSINMEPNDSVKFTLEGMGQDRTMSTSAPSGATYGSAPTGKMLTSVNVLPIIYDGDPANRVRLQSFSFSVGQNLEGQDELGFKALTGVEGGEIDITCSGSAYFADDVLYQKFRNNTPFSLGWIIEDNQGHGYGFYMGRVQIQSDDNMGGGKNAFVMDDFEAGASEDAEMNNEQLSICRW